MAENTAPETMGIQGQAPLYVRPEPLNPDSHGGLGVDMRQNPYGFAAKQHFVPLVAAEFPQACTVYPIIFAGDELVPLAVMGLAAEENFFFHETVAYALLRANGAPVGKTDFLAGGGR